MLDCNMFEDHNVISASPLEAFFLFSSSLSIWNKVEYSLKLQSDAIIKSVLLTWYVQLCKLSLKNFLQTDQKDC